MELEGRLNPAMSLPEVLQFLSMGKMTGTLTVTQDGYSATLVIRQGKLINSSNLSRPRRLGQMLINRGLIPRSAIEDALAFQKQNAPQTPLGQILIQRGNVTTDQVRQAIRLQLEEEMWELFAVQEGSFKFEHGDERAISGDSLVQLDIDPLLIEGTRRQDEWAHIVKNMPHGDTTVPAVNNDGDHLDRDAMTFSDNEWRILSLINGFYNLGSIASRSGIGKFETFRIVNSFLASGHIIVDVDASDRGAGQPGAKSNGYSSSPGGPGNSSLSNGTDDESDYSFNGAAPEKISASPDRGTSLPEKNGASAAPPVLSASGAGSAAFVSPVGFAAALANALLAELMANPDFPVGPADDKLAEEHWHDLLMQFPKADLLRASGRIVSAERFERFVQTAGFDDVMRPIYDDSLEALLRYTRLLYMLAGQRLGQKNVQALASRLFDDFWSRAKVGNSDNFYFQDFTGKIYS